MLNNKSPYLDNPGRLSDVLAAIQVMAIYRVDNLQISDWARRISGCEKKEKHWNKIFSSHPEFFLVKSGSASLLWRNSSTTAYHVEYQKTLSKSELDSLSDTARAKVISKEPLDSEEISTLMSTAISLHARAVEQAKETRWLSSPLFSLLGVVLGAGLVILFK